MPFSPVPSHKQIQAALRTALLAILPTGVSVIEGQNNNVSEPLGDFVVMTVIRRERISTNIDTYEDCRFTGSIAGTTVTVSSTDFGSLVAGRILFGTGAATNPTINTVNPNGTLTISAPMTLASRTLASGAKALKQATRVVFQLDVHSDDMSRASDMAQTISTVMRDDTGYLLLAQSNLPITPLFADDPRQIPYQNAENQTEDRYVVECHLQADQVITPPQEFMDRVDVDRIPADIFFAA
jgi:hypothetical protein